MNESSVLKRHQMCHQILTVFALAISIMRVYHHPFLSNRSFQSGERWIPIALIHCIQVS